MSSGHPSKQDREGEVSRDKNGYLTSLPLNRMVFHALVSLGPSSEQHSRHIRIPPYFRQTPDTSAWIIDVFTVSPCRKTLWELRLEALPPLYLVCGWLLLLLYCREKDPDLKAGEAGDL